MKDDPFADIHFHLENVERDFLEKSEIKNTARQTDRHPAYGTSSGHLRILLSNRIGIFRCKATAARTYRYGHKRLAMDSENTAPIVKRMVYCCLCAVIRR